MTIEDIKRMTAELQDITPDPYKWDSSSDIFRVMYMDMPGTSYLKVVARAGTRLIAAMWHVGWCAFDFESPIEPITEEQMTQNYWRLTVMGADIMHNLMEHYEGTKP